MARGKAKPKGKHAAPDGVGNVGSYGVTSGWGVDQWYDRDTRLVDEDHGLDAQPLVPEISTFDIETGAHVAAQVPADDTRFGRAWRDPEPEVPKIPRHQHDDDGSGHNVPGEGRSRSSRRPVVALVLLLMATAAVVAFVAYGAELWGGRRVPDLVGNSAGNARSALEERGLVMEVVTQPVDDGVGFVLATDPPVGVRVEVGGTVVVTVGAARVVPVVTGMAEAEARAALAEAGAVQVRASYQASDAPEGTVVGVTPAEGEAFTSRDVVTITIAQATAVPDVIGLSLREAQAAVAEAGYASTIVEVAAPGTAIGTVVEIDPIAGTKLEVGSEVTLRIAAGTPSSFEHVTEYFAASSPAIGEYVAGQGFSLRSGWTNESDEAQALYQSNARGTLAFTSRPFSHAFETWRGGSGDDVLSEGYQFLGVRWEVPASMLPEGAAQLSDAAMASLMTTCMLSDASDSCTQDDIVMPAGSVKSGARFRCTSGEVSGLVWTVLLANDGSSTRAVATCAPKSLYDEYDLSAYGGRVCCMVAYADMYTE